MQQIATTGYSIYRQKFLILLLDMVFGSVIGQTERPVIVTGLCLSQESARLLYVKALIDVG